MACDASFLKHYHTPVIHFGLLHFKNEETLFYSAGPISRYSQLTYLIMSRESEAKGKGPNKDKDKDANDGKGKESNDIILDGLVKLCSSNESKLNLILAQNVEMKTAISNITKEISDLKNSLDFMNTTIEELQKDIAVKTDQEVFEKFELEIREKIDDLTYRSMRNNLIFWNIPEKSEAGRGCVDLIYTILDCLLEIEWVEKIIIERAHRSKEVKTDKNSKALPCPIHVKFLNWEDKEYILKLAPSKLKNNLYQGKTHIVMDDVTKKVRDKRKSLRNNYLDEICGRPDVKVAFIPFLVPARIQYKEKDSWKFFYLPSK